MDQNQSDEICATSLRLLSLGQLSQWSGLQSNCSREHAEQALGPTASGPDGVAKLGDSLGGFRLYPATSAAPYGLIVWFVDNKIVTVQINQPHLDKPLKEQIGEPEGTAPSMLKTLQTQWIYAGRGLTAHVSEVNGTISSLYAYHPMTVAEFLRSSLSRVSSRRIPLR